MREELICQLARSWAAVDSDVTPTEEILTWVEERKRNTHVEIRKIPMAQMQDWLELGKGSRINTPGTDRDNWQWRLLPGELTVKLIGDIREMTRIYGRLPAKQSKT